MTTPPETTTPAPLRPFKKPNYPALGALLLAALCAATVHFIARFLMDASFHGGSIVVAFSALWQVLPNAWLIILTLCPIWIVILMIGRILALRLWAPAALWKYVVSAAATAIVLALLLGVVVTLVAYGPGLTFSGLAHSAADIRWWIELFSHGVVAALGAALHVLFIRLLKADQPR